MKDVSFVLRIADILFVFRSLNADTMRILRHHYKDYVYEIPPQQGKSVLINTVYITLMPFRVRGRRVKNQNGIYTIPTLPMKRHFKRFNGLLRGVVSYELAKHGGLLLHGSVLVQKNKGYAFIGHEGAGKSTVRKLYDNLLCLGDDTAIVRKIGRRWYVYGSPFYQRTNRTYSNTRVSLGGIFALSKQQYHGILGLGFEESVQALLSNVFTFDVVEKKIEIAALSRSIFSLAQAHPVYVLHFKKEATFFPLIQKRIKVDHLRQKSKYLLEPHYEFFRDLGRSHIQWQAGIAELSLLRSVSVIREPSWNFEFQGKRNLKDIHDKVFKASFDSAHARRIKTLSRKTMPTLLKTVYIFLKEPNSTHFVCLDGNHRICALYHRMISSTRKRTSPRCISYILGTMHKNNLFWARTH